MRNFSDKSCTENQNTHILYSVNFVSKIMPFMRYCGKILEGWAGHRRQYSACALHTEYLRLQIRVHTLRLRITHCFSTATMIVRTRLIVTLTYIACLFLNYSNLIRTPVY